MNAKLKMKRYRQSLSLMGEPKPLSEHKGIKMDLRGLMRFAREKGVSVIDLNEEEKMAFVNLTAGERQDVAGGS